MDSQEESGFVLRPQIQNKFRAAVGKKILEETATELLSGQIYHDKNVEVLSKNVSETVRQKLKDLQLPQYKYLIEVVIGEQRGQGTRIHSACYWDIDTDCQVSHLYQNDSLFCQMVVFAVFCY
uniref:Uncharacterized protein n=1 Tax=Acrobeloides nanus TaxID=290746 RepID=A0A914DF91_9BILA